MPCQVISCGQDWWCHPSNTARVCNTISTMYCHCSSTRPLPLLGRITIAPTIEFPVLVNTKGCQIKWGQDRTIRTKMCCYCSHRAPIQHQDISFKDASLKDPTDTALLCKLFLYDWFPQNTCLPLQPPISIAQSVSPVVELVSEVVRGHHVQQEDVLGLGVQAGHFELHLWKHLPRRENI